MALQRLRYPRLSRVCVAISLVAAQLLWAAGPPELPDPGKPRMTRDEQKQLGLQVAGQVYTQMPVLPDSSPETQYIQALGKRLVNTIPTDRSWPFQFHVVAQKEINAFALPGGPMFVNIGTITAADNEAELAGVMGHEMAHVYMQHSAKQQDKSSLLQGLAGLAGAAAGALGGIAGTAAQTGIQIGAGTLLLKYSRGDEAQADAVGAIILWKAGINPIALADFFQKLAAEGSNGPQFLSDHPNPGNRRASIQAEIKDWPKQQYSGDSAQFTDVKKHATGVRAYDAKEIADGAKNGQWTAENKKNGAVFPDAPAPKSAATMAPVSISAVQPSANLQLTDLGALRIARPQNWEVLDSQQSSATIAPRAGVSGGAVAYGVVIRSMRMPAANMSPTQLTAAIADSLQSSDSNMKSLGQVLPLTVGGISGGTVQLETTSPMTDADGKTSETGWLRCNAHPLQFTSFLSQQQRITNSCGRHSKECCKACSFGRPCMSIAVTDISSKRNALGSFANKVFCASSKALYCCTSISIRRWPVWRRWCGRRVLKEI
jgi:predicted Zn-dependent protease